MDDPRSPHSLIKTDADLADRMPLSAQANGVRTVDDWLAQLRQSAYVLQTSPFDPRAYQGWRQKARSIRNRARRMTGKPTTW